MTFGPNVNPNPYLPNATPTEQITPDLGDVLEYALRRAALGLRVCMPASVVKVRGPQYVDIKPLLKQRVNTETVDYPVVGGALVCMPVGADFALTTPLAIGDTGLMLCADRSLDAYIQGDGTTPTDPDSLRCHELTDAIFIPGLVPRSKQTAPTTDIVLRNGLAQMRVQKAGKLTFSNGAVELMDALCALSSQLSTLANTLMSAQVTTSTGPAPFSPSTIVALQSSVASVQVTTAKLQSLKGTP